MLPAVTAVLLIMGTTAVLYPLAGNLASSHAQDQAIDEYAVRAQSLSPEERTCAVEDARRYNERLACGQGASIYDLARAEPPGSAVDGLDIAEAGIIGYVSISTIDVRLPICRGDIDPDMLTKAAGHVRGTSLPVGGADTHCVIYAHRGLPGARLFSDLDKVEIGDTFTISSLGGILDYQIDQILLVEPDDDTALRIDAGKDYCTLLTCAPYGINTHRLLVRGTHTKSILYDGWGDNGTGQARESYLAPVTCAFIGTLGAFEGVRTWRGRHARHLRKILREKG